MKLSVVILNYNVRYFLELCLKSVQDAIRNLDAEIIVVDNDSEDDSCSMVRELFPNVVLIQNKENFGFSKGNNIAVKEAKGEFLCILNPDTVVAEDTFEKLLQFSENKNRLGIVGCKLINGVGKFLPESKRNIPYVKAALLKLIGNSNSYYAKHIEEEGVGEVDILVGAFMFMRKVVYQEMNGFDEDYFMYGEDIDLSYKVFKSGYSNYYFGETTVIHYKGESTLKDQNYARRFYGAMQIFYRKHFKKNILFDLLVWLGIKMIYILRLKPKGKPKKVSQYVFVSKEESVSLKRVLKKNVVLDYNMKHIKANDEVIIDANALKYKRIISIIEKLGTQKNVTFKILPKKSNYIIGSDNAINRGEVLKWD